MRTRKRWAIVMMITMVLGTMHIAAAVDADRIRPYEANPTYWQYKGEPVLLIGGSDQDNLFNHPHIPPDGLEAHLDVLVSVGGNYVRNTMSTREAGNLYAYEQDSDTGLYDLDTFNEAYWQRFRDFLDMTSARDIIVQIEVFDRFDFARDAREMGGWSRQPFNPRNNINYTAEESRLPEEITTHPGQLENPFFRTTPEQEDNPLVLQYQEAYVEKMLSISLEYGNVLYCVSNETNESEHWSAYWAHFIRQKADEAGVGVEVTEMWDPWDLSHPMHRFTFDHPELYSFVDISQNTHQVGQTHWDNMQAARQRLLDPARPINNVKIYGGTPHGGGLEEGTHKLWRNVLGGLASSRFHRPDSGAGLSELAQTHLKSMRMLVTDFDVFPAEPHNDLLRDRDKNEAYCAATPGVQYAVYFPAAGSVTLDTSEADGPMTLRWLEIEQNRWHDPEDIESAEQLELNTPGEGQWAVLVEVTQ